MYLKLTNSHKLSIEQIKNLLNVTCCPIQECPESVSKASAVCHIAHGSEKNIELENMQSKINEIVKDALIEIKFTTRESKIKWVKDFLNSVNYRKIKHKKTKGMVREIISNITDANKRTVSKWLKLYKLNLLKTGTYKKNKFHRKYLNEDIILLADVDSKIEKLSAESLKNSFIREYKIFNNNDFKRLSSTGKLINNSCPCNIRIVAIHLSNILSSFFKFIHIICI